MAEIPVFRIPASFDEIFHSYRIYRGSLHKIWSVMPNADFQAATTAVFNSIRAALAMKDQRNTIKALIAIKIVGKVRQSYTNQLASILLDALPLSDEGPRDFAAFVVAKFCGKKYISDSWFLQQIVTKCGEFMSPKSKNVKQGIMIIGWLAKLSSHALQVIPQQFVDVVVDGIFNRDLDIRMRAAEALSIFVSHVRRRMFVGCAFKRAESAVGLDNIATRHSCIVIFTIAATYDPSSVKDEVESVMALAGKMLEVKDTDVVFAAARLMVAVAQIDPRMYGEYRTAFNAIVFRHRPSPDLVKAAIPLFDALPDTFADQADEIMATIKRLLLRKEDDVAFSLLVKFVQVLPAKVAARTNGIIEMVNRIPKLETPFLTLVPIFHSWSVIWKGVEAGVVSKLTPSVVSFRLMVECPDFSDQYLGQLFKMLDRELGSPNLEVRRCIPAALLRLDKYDSMANCHVMLRLATTCTDTKMRLAFLGYFRPLQYQAMVAMPQSLEYIRILAHDEDVEVRRAAIRLLHELAKIDTDRILPIFRKMILSAIFLLTTDCPLQSKEEVSRVLPEMLSCSEVLLAIYIPVLVPVMLSFLTTHAVPAQQMTLQQTYFQRRHAITIGARYIETITLTFREQPTLLDDHYTHIMELYISILEGTGNKTLVLAILHSFQSILDYKELSVLDDFPDLMHILFSLGSKFTSVKVVKELFRVLGRIGPKNEMVMWEKSHDQSKEHVDMWMNRVSVNENWYLSVIASSLLSLLEEDGSRTVQVQALQVLANMLHQKHEFLHHYFDMLVRHLMASIRSALADEIDGYFTVLQLLIENHSLWLKPLCPEFSELFKEYQNSRYMMQILSLVPQFVRRVRGAFAPYLLHVISGLMETLFVVIQDAPIAQRVLFTIGALAEFSSDHLDFLVLKISECITHPLVANSVIIAALNALRVIVKECDCVHISAQLFRICRYCLKMTDDGIKVTAASMMSALGAKFTLFSSHSISEINESMRGFEDQPAVVSYYDRGGMNGNEGPMYTSDLNENLLIGSASCGPGMSSAEAKDWMNRLVHAVITNSPIHVIGMCACIADQSQVFALKIFPVAFHTCWLRMSNYAQMMVSKYMCVAISDPGVPLSVLVTVVCLAEFMERSEQRLEIPYIQLARAAERAERLPFAFYCAGSAWFGSSPTSQQGRSRGRTQGHRTGVAVGHRMSFTGFQHAPVMSTASGRPKLMSPYPSEKRGYIPQLIKTRAAKSAQSEPGKINEIVTALSIMSQLSMDADVRNLMESADVESLPILAGHLRDWRQAILVYSGCADKDENFLYLLEAHAKLHEWNEIVEHHGSRFDGLPSIVKKSSALIFASAFFHLEDWPKFEQMMNATSSDFCEPVILRATADVMRGKDIREVVDRGFALLAIRGGPLFAHEYASITPLLVQAQQLIELEEFAERKTSRWAHRNRSCLYAYRPLYEMRITLSRDVDELRSYLKMLRKAEDWETHEFYCNMFPDNPHVMFESSLRAWKCDHENTMTLLNNLVEVLDEGNPLKQRVLCTIAKVMIKGEMTADEMMRCVEITEKSGTKQAWSILAWLHSRLYFLKVGDREEHAIKAIEGFLRNPGLPEGQQLISMLMRSGKFPRVLEAVKPKLEELPASLLLNILPQLGAQLNNEHQAIVEIGRDMLRRLMREHHHRVVFPVLFGCCFGNAAQTVFRGLMDEYERECPEIVRDANVLYKGLLSLSSTLGETLMESLRVIIETWKNSEESTVRAAVDSLRDELNKGDSQDRVDFREKFGERVYSIGTLFDNYYQQPVNERNDDTVNRVIVSIFKEIKANTDSLRSIAVDGIAPELDKIHDVDIAVPGTYTIGAPIIRIQWMCNSVEVFTSKQRPKKLSMTGSDGIEYFYLLKGGEDMRLDERAMQFFALINSLIQLKIVTYFVLPLSPSDGLIQWLNDTDTMSKLIREFKDSHRAPEHMEFAKMAAMTHENFDSLRPIQRLEALQAVAAETPDSVLADVLWLRSTNPEQWLHRVSTFSKTSALMSIVGYILGLGDRHPSNLMIHREQGTVIHIDFGDCFEVTRDRLQLPELIPFRLTRFMVRALGPGGVGGLFRVTCENAMQLIHGRRESVMAVLEIFAYSPIVLQGAPSGTGRAELVDKTIKRIMDKLYGNDFSDRESLTYREQVAELIASATDPYNLAHVYRGWRPLW